MGEHENGLHRSMGKAQGHIKMLYTNCRSAKGKATELSALTSSYDLICLTETHVDKTITNRSIINRDDLVFFRKDRNIMEVAY